MTKATDPSSSSTSFSIWDFDMPTIMAVETPGVRGCGGAHRVWVTWSVGRPATASASPDPVAGPLDQTLGRTGVPWRWPAGLGGGGRGRSRRLHGRYRSVAARCLRPGRLPEPRTRPFQQPLQDLLRNPVSRSRECPAVSARSNGRRIAPRARRLTLGPRYVAPRFPPRRRWRVCPAPRTDLR